MRSYEQIEQRVYEQLDALADVADRVLAGSIEASAANAYTAITKEQRQLLKIAEVARREHMIAKAISEILQERGLTEDSAMRIIDRLYAALDEDSEAG